MREKEQEKQRERKTVGCQVFGKEDVQGGTSVTLSPGQKLKYIQTSTLQAPEHFKRYPGLGV